MKLKKIVSLATSVVLSTSLLVGCSGKNKGNGGNKVYPLSRTI